MSSSPKKEEYEATSAEKASAGVAAAEQAYFRSTYQPLLRQMRDKATGAQDRYTDVLQDRAQADTMQALTGGRPNLKLVQGVDYAANIASGAAGQMAQARVKGKDIATTMQTGVLGTARGQQADAASGLAAASRFATSSKLAEARAKQEVRMARTGAALQIGTAFGSQMTGNIRQQKQAKKLGMMGQNQKINPFKTYTGYTTNTVGSPGNQAQQQTATWGWSDIRLKENIVYLGQSQGFNIYIWDWNDKAKEMGINDPTTGVIAQELPSELVKTDSSGYLLVNYGAL